LNPRDAVLEQGWCGTKKIRRPGKLRFISAVLMSKIRFNDENVVDLAGGVQVVLHIDSQFVCCRSEYEI